MLKEKCYLASFTYYFNIFRIKISEINEIIKLDIKILFDLINKIRVIEQSQ